MPQAEKNISRGCLTGPTMLEGSISARYFARQQFFSTTRQMPETKHLRANVGSLFPVLLGSLK